MYPKKANHKILSASTVLFILFISSIFCSPHSMKAQPSEPSTFGTKQRTSAYIVSQGENADWYYLKIDQEVTDYDGSVSHDIEYVGFSKNQRGDIGFTTDGDYVARLIPVVCGKFGGNWWLVPIRNVDTVTSLGVENSYDEIGNYTEIFYGGFGTFTAYQYDNYATQQNVDLTVDKMAIRCYLATGECKVKANISLGATPQDTGFGFIFYPSDPVQFRYMKYEVENETRTIDLLNVGKVSNVTNILEFWSQAGERLGIKWRWQDLYEMGPNSHFEILNIQGLYGLLTGSYGYGALQNIVVDPSLTVSESASELSIVNSWNSGADGYNMTFLASHMVIDRMYDYERSAWLWDADQSETHFMGLRQVMDFTTGGDPRTNEATATWAIIEESDTRIRFNVTGSDDEMDFLWEVTVYPASDVFFMETTWTSTNSTTRTLDIFYGLLTCDNTNDDSYVPTEEHDYTDEVYCVNSTEGGWAFLTINYTDEAGDDWDYIATNDDGIFVYDADNRAISLSETTTVQMVFGIHSLTTSAMAWSDELDDEICDAFPSISSVSGLTYNGRNNETGSFDFTHSSGNNASFSFTDVDTEQNFTAFHLDNWNRVNYTIWKDDVLQTEDTHYYAAYNSTTLDLDIVYPELSTCTFEIIALDNAPTIGSFSVSSSAVKANELFTINATINDDDGATTFSYATIELSEGIILKWTNSTDTFTEQQDTNEYCQLGGFGSSSTLNSTAKQITYSLSLRENMTEGAVDLIATDTKVVDQYTLSGTNSHSNLFTFSRETPQPPGGTGPSGTTPPQEEDGAEEWPPHLVPAPPEPVFTFTEGMYIIVAVVCVLGAVYALKRRKKQRPKSSEEVRKKYKKKTTPRTEW